jgi:hypothetical protein
MLIDGDGHYVEPATLSEDYMSAEFRERTESMYGVLQAPMYDYVRESQYERLTWRGALKFYRLGEAGILATNAKRRANVSAGTNPV